MSTTPPTPGPQSVRAEVLQALRTVDDPELHRPITDLGMVDGVDVDEAGLVDVRILLTTAGCPMRDTLTREVTAAVRTVDGARGVRVHLGEMTSEQRRELTAKVRGTTGAAPTIPFNDAGNLTRVYAVASGKGGVGKSSVTANLAAAMAADGLRVGLLDADVHGFSIPRLLDVRGTPTKVEDMIIPPVAHGVKVISIGMFVPGNQPVAWRGPMLHRALQQFASEVHWGDLDVLLLDLPRARATSPSAWASCCRGPRSSSSRRRRSRPPRWPSAPGRWPRRPSSGSSASWRT